jgi:hypothetical protein
VHHICKTLSREIKRLAAFFIASEDFTREIKMFEKPGVANIRERHEHNETRQWIEQQKKLGDLQAASSIRARRPDREGSYREE